MSTGKGCRRRSLEADYVSVLKALKLYIKFCYVKKKKINTSGEYRESTKAKCL